MPIGESEWKSVEPKSSVFTEVRMFLQENPSRAYTAGEVATDYSGRNADGDPSVQAQNMAVVLETLAWVSYTFNMNFNIQRVEYEGTPHYRAVGSNGSE